MSATGTIGTAATGDSTPETPQIGQRIQVYERNCLSGQVDHGLGRLGWVRRNHRPPGEVRLVAGAAIDGLAKVRDAPIPIRSSLAGLDGVDHRLRARRPVVDDVHRRAEMNPVKEVPSRIFPGQRHAHAPVG